MVYKPRVLGIILAFVTGLATSLFILKESAPVTTETTIDLKGTQNEPPASLYLNESAHAVSPLPKKDNLTLLILVFSAPDAKDMRQAVRNTWASDLMATDNVMYFFVVNVLQLSHRTMVSLEGEKKFYGDMMYLNETPSSMANSRTLLRALDSAHKNFRFKFLLKCNDASYVRVPEILKELEELSSTDLVWGFFVGNESVERQGNRAERVWNLCTKYLPYPQGGGYILSRDIVGMLVVMGPDLGHMDNEDIAVGVWLAPFNVQRRHDVKFNTGLESRGCNNAYLVTHPETVRSMKEKHQSLRRKGTLCALEHQDGLSYVYNWTAPVSDCCIHEKGIP